MINTLARVSDVSGPEKMVGGVRELAGRIVATVREPLVVLDGGLRVVFLNQSFERLLATTTRASVGQRLADVAERQLDQPALYQLLQDVLEHRTSAENFGLEIVLPHTGKRTLLLNVRSIAHRAAHGALLLLAFEDVTSHHHAAARQTAERDGFGVQLATRGHELAAALEALAAERKGHERTAAALRHADRLATVGKLAASTAHELGTPLNVIAARAKLIERGQVEGAAVEHNAQIIGQQAERMTTLLRRLLDFSRARQAERHADNLGALTQATIGVLDPLARKQGVTLTVRVVGFDEEDLSVDADAVEIQQVITNLVVNGIDAQPGGGAVEVAVRTDMGTPPGSRTAIRCVAIAVRDEGPGISPEQRDKLFEPFYTSKAPGKGTGLGLAVSRTIVEGAGGWILVQSEGGKGTTFQVYLPTTAPTGTDAR